MKHIVSFSSGLSSAICADRVLERFGKEDVEIIFMDTLIEDDDNYRFLQDCVKRWGPEVKIIKLVEGRTPYQVATDRQIIPNQKIAPCTFLLKINIFRNYLKLKDYKSVTIYVGYDVWEAERLGPTRRNYKEYGWEVEAPLMWEPYLNQTYAEVVKGWGIEPPRMYELGYTHANCGGCCVKQGQSDWLRTLINFPDRFKKVEEWEQGMRQHPIRKNYGLLRLVVKGKVQALTLKELRERYANKTLNKQVLKRLDYDAGCNTCGIGLMDTNIKPETSRLTQCKKCEAYFVPPSLKGRLPKLCLQCKIKV